MWWSTLPISTHGNAPKPTARPSTSRGSLPADISQPSECHVWSHSKARVPISIFATQTSNTIVTSIRGFGFGRWKGGVPCGSRGHICDVDRVWNQSCAAHCRQRTTHTHSSILVHHKLLHDGSMEDKKVIYGDDITHHDSSAVASTSKNTHQERQPLPNNNIIISNERCK